MPLYILYAVLAGIAWGVGGFFEKAGLKEIGLPPIVGIALRTAVALIILGLLSIPAWQAINRSAGIKSWLMIIIGGGIIAGSLGMWCFYSSLSLSDNLGITLAIAFAFSPIAGTVTGLLKGNQHMDLKTGLGLISIVFGIILIQLSHKA